MEIFTMEPTGKKGIYKPFIKDAKGNMTVVEQDKNGCLILPKNIQTVDQKKGMRLQWTDAIISEGALLGRIKKAVGFVEKEVSQVILPMACEWEFIKEALGYWI